MGKASTLYIPTVRCLKPTGVTPYSCKKMYSVQKNCKHEIYSECGTCIWRTAHSVSGDADERGGRIESRLRSTVCVL